MSFLDFVKKFLLLLRAPLHIFDKSTAVDVCLEFVAKFAQSLPSEEDDAMLTSEASETEAETNRFVKTLFQFILAVRSIVIFLILLGAIAFYFRRYLAKLKQFASEDVN